MALVRNEQQKFTKSLSLFTSVPDSGIERAKELLQLGSLYRYCASVPEESEVALFEKEFSEYVGSRFAIAVNSCGGAMYIALLSLGVKPGDKVLSSAFTYTAVPSAITNAGGRPILVECDRNYCIDTEDLKRKITPETKVFLLSHMRGHVSKMDEVKKICQEYGINMIEDCAHSLGARYDGVHTGLFGKVGCFSTQSHKMINSGEGGVLITNDEEIAAKAILYAGSQETFWKKHFIDSPTLIRYLEKYQEYIPNISMRMSNLAAAILRPQLLLVDEWVENYRTKYNALIDILSQSKYIITPEINKKVRRGQDTIQFNFKNLDISEIQTILELLAREGIKIKTFGYEGNPRFFKSWKYIEGIDSVSLPQTENILPYACDLRLPLYLTMDDIQVIGETILNTINKVTNLVKA